MEEFFGLSAGAWTAIGTMAIAVITGLLVLGGLYQVSAIRHENKKAATLEQCFAYEANPVLSEAATTLRTAKDSGDLEKDPKKYRNQLVVLLNYLDGIAIGIAQGIFIEDLAWDHMNAIVARHLNTYVDSGLLQKADVMREDYVCLLELRDRWSRARPRFEDRGRWRFWKSRRKRA